MSQNHKTILITGGAGFLGCHLSRHYLKLGYKVIGVDNLATGRMENIEWLRSLDIERKNYSFYKHDVCEDWDFLESVPTDNLRSLKTLLHFASPASPPQYSELALETLWVNSLGLKNALSCADRWNARLVFASTSEIYGDPEVSPQPETYWGRVNSFGVRSCYDEAKRFGEALIFTHNSKKSTAHGLVRIFNTYGPRMNPSDGRVVINFLVQGLQGRDLTVFGKGKQTRSFCFVDDLVKAISLYVESAETQPINIGNDIEFTILELAEKVKALFSDKNLKIVFRDLPSDDPMQRRPDLKLAKTLLGYQPRISLEQGLVLMTEHLRGELKL